MKNNYLYLLVLLPAFILGQQDTKIAFYQQNLQLYNPAATGLEDQTTLSSNIRSQWQGIDGAPSVQTFNLSVPGGEKRLGYGAVILVDQTFVERQTRLFATFSYRLPVGNGNSLYLGIQGGGNHINLDFDGLNLAHDDDSELSNLSRFYSNVGVGAYYKTERFYFSLSAPMLFGHKNEKKKDAIIPTPADDSHLYFSAGLRLPAFAEDWKYVASTLTRWVPNAPTSLVFNVGMAYQKSELLLAYHQDSSLGASLLLDTGGTISIGYAYQFPTPSLLSKLQSGNHEFILRIRFNNKKTRAIEPQATEEIDDLAMN